MKIKLLSILVLFVLLFSCTPEKQVEVGQISLIPKPVNLVEGDGFFEFNSSTAFVVKTASQEKIASLFATEFKQIADWQPEVSVKSKDASVQFITKNDIAKEGYELEVTKEVIKISASSDAGFFYGLQTLKQLFPPSFFGKEVIKDVVFQIPTVSIKDKPNLKWRGYMLDVSRHFFDKEQIKEVLDFMSAIKLNRFHWHLSDDQGWRIEIKKYPKLTEVGAWRVDYNITDEAKSNWWGRPVQKEGEKATYGGFYTQEDIKEIVAYAKERQIEIIPEIDMPGHSMATIASYPEISCAPGPFTVATGGVMLHNTLCPGKEATFEFVDGVIKELATLFPYKYIHLGGDECNKTDWENDADCQLRIQQEGLKDEEELQGYFSKRVEKIASKYGKQMIGWDEVLEGGIAPNTAVMSWRGEKGGIAAAREGHDVVMSPFKYCYLDLKQGDDDFEPNLGYRQNFLENTYNYKVISDSLTTDEAQYVLGVQANLWTESISDFGKLTYMTFPRLYAVAENGWIKEEDKNWDSFTKRLLTQFQRLDAQGIRYATSAYNVVIQHKGTKEKAIKISLETQIEDLAIYYTLDGSTPTLRSLKYSEPILLEETTTVKATSFLGKEQTGNIATKTFPIHKGFGAKVAYHSPKELKKRAKKRDALVDLTYGKLSRWDSPWKKIKGDLDVDLIFPKPIEASSVLLTTLSFTNGGVYIPKNIEIYGSENGKDFVKLGEKNLDEQSLEQGRYKHDVMISFTPTRLKILKVKAKRVDPIPAGHHLAGKEATIQIDEIVVE
ncbi:family 20 glycosylhydrolase [Polaribacter sp.]|nr:family 20 glycosylhydrolase [Polaribacter sp.]